MVASRPVTFKDELVTGFNQVINKTSKPLRVESHPFDIASSQLYFHYILAGNGKCFIVFSDDDGLLYSIDHSGWFQLTYNPSLSDAIYSIENKILKSPNLKTHKAFRVYNSDFLRHLNELNIMVSQYQETWSTIVLRFDSCDFEGDDTKFKLKKETGKTLEQPRNEHIAEYK